MKLGSQREEGSEAPAEQPEEAEEKQKDREYVVLGKTDDGTWRELGKQTATTDKKAIAPFAVKNMQAKEQAEGQGVPTFSAYVAVPSRSFRPRQPKPKEQTAPQLSW